MPHSTLITMDSAAPEPRAPEQLKSGAGLDMEAGEVWDARPQPKSQALQSDTAPSIAHLDLQQSTGGDAPNCTQSPRQERQTPSQESRHRGKHGDKRTKTGYGGRPRAGADEVRMGACAPVLPFLSPGLPQDL